MRTYTQYDEDRYDQYRSNGYSIYGKEVYYNSFQSHEKIGEFKYPITGNDLLLTFLDICDEHQSLLRDEKINQIINLLL